MPQADAFYRVVVEVDVCNFHRFSVGGYRIGIDAEAVVLAGNFAATRAQVFHRVVDAAVAVVHFEGADADRQSQQLMAQANAKQRFVFFENGLRRFHRVVHRSRVAGAVRQEIAVGIPVA